MTARPVSGANNPLRRIWNRKGGASPESADVGGDSFTAMTISTGMPPRAAASRYVRHRRHAFISSTLNTGALHERHEDRSEEHTSELQSRVDIVCRLLLEKKK